MEIDNLLDNAVADDKLLAFLTAYVPISFSGTSSDKLSKIDYRKMDELIQNGPEKYLDPICIKACKKMWEKNIYVLASIDINDDLYLILDRLDAENMRIFRNKYKENSENYFMNMGTGKYFGVVISDYAEIENCEAWFVDLVSDFKMQDIQRGYLTEKTFLMKICNCEKVEGLREYKKHKNQDLRVVFDINKMEKSFKEYLKETGYENLYIPQEHRIYINDYYYEAHQNYKKSKLTV